MQRVLLVTEGFYDYDKAMCDEIRTAGYEVDLYEAVVNVTYWEKLIHKADLEAYLEKKRAQKQKVLLNSKIYDIVLVICGHSLSVKVFKQFRENQKNAKFILYMWDDIDRIKNYNQISVLFDKIITFDRCDAEKYQLEFRPLFYLEGYKYRDQEKKYDVCFVGWLHSERKELVKTIVEKYFSLSNSFIYFLTGKYTVLKNMLMKKDNGMSKCLHTSRLSSTESMEILCGSKFTIDIQHETQKGLTMRTIESLAAHTKLITTNTEVQYYDFYNTQNICIIDRNNPVIDEEFLESGWNCVKKEIEDKYSLRQWVLDVIGD